MNTISSHSHSSLKFVTFLSLLTFTSTASNAYQSSPAGQTQSKEPPYVVLIAKFDQNGDGVLNYNEFSANEPIRFSIQDEDGNGMLTMKEFSKHTGKIRKNKKKITHQKSTLGMTGGQQEKLLRNRGRVVFSQFSSIDTNNDGQLSADEIHESHFLRLDTNKNGVLDVSELVMKKKNRNRNGQKNRNEF